MFHQVGGPQKVVGKTKKLVKKKKPRSVKGRTGLKTINKKK